MTITPMGGSVMVFMVGVTFDDHRSRTCTRTCPDGHTSVSVGGGGGSKSGPASLPPSGSGGNTVPSEPASLLLGLGGGATVGGSVSTTSGSPELIKRCELQATKAATETAADAARRRYFQVLLLMRNSRLSPIRSTLDRHRAGTQRVPRSSGSNHHHGIIGTPLIWPQSVKAKVVSRRKFDSPEWRSALKTASGYTSPLVSPSLLAWSSRLTDPVCCMCTPPRSMTS